jgi:hypothetical protein
MSGSGRRASQPPAGWTRPERRNGLQVQFVSEDGTERKLYDFSTLPGRPEVAGEFAAGFAEATGPLGTWKRLGGTSNLWQSARQAAKWLADNRPSLVSLAQLTAADTRLLIQSFRVPSGDGLTASLKSLLRYSPGISDDVRRVLSRHRVTRRETARQPYTDGEFRRINVVARGIVRQARERIRGSWGMVADFRAGHFDHLPERDGRRCLAESLDHCARTGDYPRSAAGAQTMSARRAAEAAGGQPLMSLLHLRPREAWAFAVLLASQTSLNMSVLATLPAPHLLASAPDEPGIALVNANKPRRASRSAMTLPFTALPEEIRPADLDNPRHKVLNTSLTTPFGVFALLVELTEPGRRLIGGDRAFIYYGTHRTPDGHILWAGLPKNGRIDHASEWVREWLTGDDDHDELLLNISLDRLRKTYLERHRKPVAHTPDTLTRYLRRMNKVTEEGFQVVREALDEQVADALARRRMKVDPTADQSSSGGTAQDTVLGECEDFEHSPLDNDQRCRRTFMDCLDCDNARAFPRHLPLQLVVLDRLRALRPTVSLERWVGEFADRVAQLEDVVGQYEPAQVDRARDQITDTHHQVATRLLSGDLDPL